MGSLIFSITKLKIKLKTFKPQELAKNTTLKTTLNPTQSSHFTKFCPGRALEGSSKSGAEEQKFMSETVVL